MSENRVFSVLANHKEGNLSSSAKNHFLSVFIQKKNGRCQIEIPSMAAIFVYNMYVQESPNDVIT